MNTAIFSLFATAETLLTFVWEHGSALIALFAAWATWKAAEQAARSADIARTAMKVSEGAAQATLEETRRFNRRTSFENRYAMLLEQHNIYHQQVCNYIDRELKNGRKETVSHFFDVARTPDTLDESLMFLTGHTDISRYMRTLYHLLKFVADEFYTLENARVQMKTYVSPLRSAIRNDVLYMIAVNGLNVLTPAAQESGYPRYQELLHFFSFFEHAYFPTPFEPNLTGRESNRPDLIRMMISNNQYKYIGGLKNGYRDFLRDNLLSGDFQPPLIRLNSPALLCMHTYENYLQPAFPEAFETLVDTILSGLEMDLMAMMDTYESASCRVRCYRFSQYQETWDSEVKKCSKSLMRRIGHAVKHDNEGVFKRYCFTFPEKNESVAARDLLTNFGIVIRYSRFYKRVTQEGGISVIVQQLRDRFTQQLIGLTKDMNSYIVSKRI